MGSFEFELYLRVLLDVQGTSFPYIFHSVTTTTMHVPASNVRHYVHGNLILLPIVVNFSPAVDILISSTRSVAHSGQKTYIQEGRRRALLLQDVHVFLGCLNML